MSYTKNIKKNKNDESLYLNSVNYHDILNNNLSDIEKFARDFKMLIEKYNIICHYNGFGITSFQSDDGNEIGIAYFITKLLGWPCHSSWKKYHLT